jgi:hypothetical protein
MNEWELLDRIGGKLSYALSCHAAGRYSDVASLIFDSKNLVNELKKMMVERARKEKRV